MRRWVIAIGLMLLTESALYAAFSFNCLEANPLKWSDAARAFFSYFAFFGVPASMSAAWVFEM